MIASLIPMRVLLGKLGGEWETALLPEVPEPGCVNELPAKWGAHSISLCSLITKAGGLAHPGDAAGVPRGWVQPPAPSHWGQLSSCTGHFRKALRSQVQEANSPMVWSLSEIPH